MGMTLLVVYDDRCLFCISIKEKLGKKDTDKKLQWQGISSFNYKKYNLKKEDILKEIHVIKNGKVFKGYGAIKEIYRTLPSLRMLFLFMNIPGADFFGNFAYTIVAKYRSRH